MAEARPPFRDIAESLGIEPGFPDAVAREVRERVARPGIDDRGLTDLTSLPFVTIDGPTSNDLDQAVHVARGEGGGFLIRYAIADTAHYVPPRTALFQEALRRGASYYFPGFSVPMLPRELSEGLVSLNPRVTRRALLFEMRLDDDGALSGTKLVRTRIKSREKLAFGDVQRLYDEGERSPLARSEAAESLRLLREVGERRIAVADEHDVVRYRRRNVEVAAGDGELGFVVLEAMRDRVELYNEQISLLCNQEAGRMLAEHPAPHLQPIYRVHPAPDPERVREFVELTIGVARAHGLDPAAFTMHQGENLSRYLRRLPVSGKEGRVVRAIERQAVLLNMRSAFASEAAIHFGVGAEVYARASAPMREVVGVFLHKELLELIGGIVPPASEVDRELRERVVEAANASRETQRRINEQVNRHVLDRLFAGDLAAGAPPRSGTVMGITSSKVHVELDEPGLDVKVYLRDLGELLGRKWLETDEHGAVLRQRDGGAIVCRLGDAVTVSIRGRDERYDRWKLGLDVVP
jgi:ribonuclease R